MIIDDTTTPPEREKIMDKITGAEGVITVGGFRSAGTFTVAEGSR